LIWKQGLLDQTTSQKPSLWGEVLDAEGNSVKGPFQILDNVNFGAAHAVAYVGDGFLIAEGVAPYAEDEAVVVLHVDLDGTVEQASRWPGQQLKNFSLAWDSQEAHLLYDTYASFPEGIHAALYWQRLSQAGAVTGPARLFDGSSDTAGLSFGSQPLLPLAAHHTAVLRATGDGVSVKLSLMVIDDAADTVVPAFAISASESAPLSALVKLGDQLVVAFVGAAGFVDSQALSLARISL
jgi:hypothetical protein